MSGAMSAESVINAHADYLFVVKDNSSVNLTSETLLQHARMEWRVESMHWFLDVHFSEDKTRICDMKVQKNLNIMRKIVLNLVRIYKESLTKNISIDSILRANLFDIDHLLNL